MKTELSIEANLFYKMGCIITKSYLTFLKNFFQRKVKSGMFKYFNVSGQCLKTNLKKKHICQGCTGLLYILNTVNENDHR